MSKFAFTPEDLEHFEEIGLSIEEAEEICTPTYIGPTWQRNAFGQWILPKFTLGWEIAGWCAEWLVGDDGNPWRFTPEQLRFVLWWYAIEQGTGRFVYRTGVLQRLKGWGKDPMLAVLCLVELVGPSRLSHFDADGHPVGKPHPRAWVQVAAVNQSQTRNTMTLMPSLMSERFINHFQIVPGAELIRAHGGKQRLEAVTSSFRALEGGRSTFIVLNETHHWVRGNNGDLMYETIDGNATKMSGRYLAITNAFLPGEDSVAERMRDAYEAIVEGRAQNIGFLYDSVEAHPAAPLKGPLVPYIIRGIRGDAVWLDVDNIIQSINNGTLAPSRSRRMWYNQVVSAEDNLHGPETWDPLRDEDLLLAPGDEIVMGFDGGKTDDATALVAIRTRDAAAFVLCLEEAPPGELGFEWEVDRSKVDTAVHEAFRLYKVVGFYADVSLWESYIADWTEAYRPVLQAKATDTAPIAWDMRGSKQRTTRAHERLMSAIFDRVLKHDGDPRLRRHVLNAKRKTTTYGVSFEKESRESKRKVDLYAALMLAHEALTDLRTKTKKPKTRTGNGWFL